MALFYGIKNSKPHKIVGQKNERNRKGLGRALQQKLIQFLGIRSPENCVDIGKKRYKQKKKQNNMITTIYIANPTGLV